MRFRYDSPVFEFMNTLASFIGLNVLFLITCLPVFTIGPALTALYTVTMQEARREHGYIFSTYLKTFKSSFGPSCLGFLLYLAAAAILIFNLAFWSALGTLPANAILLILMFALVVTIISFLYTFPLLARFDGSLKQVIKSSFPIAMAHRKYTFALLAIQAAAVALCLIIPQSKIFMVLLGFSFLAYCNSFLFIRVFRDYEEDSATEETSEPSDSRPVSEQSDPVQLTEDSAASYRA